MMNQKFLRMPQILLLPIAVLIAVLLALPLCVPAAGQTSHTLVQTLPGGSPRGLAVTPDGRFLLARMAESVTLFDAATGRAVQSIPASGTGAGLCTDKEGDDIFIAGGMAPNPPLQWLTLEDGVLAFKTALTVPAGSEPAHRTISGLAYGPDKAIYVTDTSGGTLFKLVGKPRAVVASAQVGGQPGACALSREGRTLAVADAGAGTVRLFDSATLHETGRVPMKDPVALVWARDGRLFVADASANVVYVIIEGKIKGTIAATGAATPSALALSPADDRLYIGEGRSNMGAVVAVGVPSLQ